MRKYQCREIVDAVQIAEIAVMSGVVTMAPVGPGPLIKVDREFCARHQPKPGGYYIVRDDGVASYLSGLVFESLYTELGE
jgi:hypothetical protein